MSRYVEVVTYIDPTGRFRTGLYSLDDERIGECKYCHVAIRWARNPRKDTRVPIDMQTIGNEPGPRSHWLSVHRTKKAKSICLQRQPFLLAHDFI